VISASAPHIYLSALPFAPSSSLISKWYRDRFPRTIKVLHEEEAKWPVIPISILLDYPVNCVSVHPDGKRVAAATNDNTALVISVATGDILFNLQGHDGSVRAIAYASNGIRIATGEFSEYLRAGL
jgi:WD40 repeat protein